MIGASLNSLLYAVFIKIMDRSDHSCLECVLCSRELKNGGGSDQAEGAEHRRAV